LAAWVSRMREQPLVLGRASRPLTAGPPVVRRRRHVQGPANELDPEALAVRVDERAHFGRVELLGEKHRGGLDDLVGLPELAHLALERLHALALVAGQAIVAAAGISLGLAHPLAQRLAVDAQVGRDVRDRAAALEREAHRSLTQLVRILLGAGIDEASTSSRTDQPGVSVGPGLAHCARR
jgi:hypothetical protein